MQYLYIIPITLALFIAFFMVYSTSPTSGRIANEKPFQSEFFNDIYGMSFSAPFKWFINPDMKDPKVKDITMKIAEANLGNKINYRSFVTIQILIFITSIVLFLISSVLIDNSEAVISFLFNVQIGNLGDTGTSPGKSKLVVFMMLLVLAILPKFWLKFQADNNRYFYLKDMPIIQLFIILMLRSKRTLSEVLYVLSRTNTRYKKMFETGYRIYLRNKSEGFEYLKVCFTGTKFEETLTILQDYNEYAHADSITILENNMEEMVQFTNNLKRKNDLSKLLYSQGSLIIPFLAVIVLGLVPLAIYGNSFLHQASM